MKVPDGFALTAAAFRDALTAASAWDGLHALLDDLDKADVERLARAGARAREIVYAAGLTPDMEAQLRTAFRALLAEYGEGLTVAVRSSATAEDLPTASFAGQHETYLNVAGEAMLLDAVRRCHASLFTDRAISYRIDQGFDHFKVALSVGVQKMVRSDLASAGVMFTLDTESGFRDAVFITGAYGLAGRGKTNIFQPFSPLRLRNGVSDPRFCQNGAPFRALWLPEPPFRRTPGVIMPPPAAWAGGSGCRRWRSG
ncbi:Phosphoenolpyruvate synthase (EC 2.7.9.2) [Azospirillum argentinense]|uniref:PEP/pyruvate-binding domain-containing protein n=1 Tax=Azospirillum argentinense TaxID=2970906 RepID=UPI0032DF5440